MSKVLKGTVNVILSDPSACPINNVNLWTSLYLSYIKEDIVVFLSWALTISFIVYVQFKKSVFESGHLIHPWSVPLWIRHKFRVTWNFIYSTLKIMFYRKWANVLSHHNLEILIPFYLIQNLNAKMWLLQLAKNNICKRNTSFLQILQIFCKILLFVF